MTKKKAIKKLIQKVIELSEANKELKVRISNQRETIEDLIFVRAENDRLRRENSTALAMLS